MCQLGHNVYLLDTQTKSKSGSIKQVLYKVSNRAGHPLDLAGANNKILQVLKKESFDIVWVDSVRNIKRATLKMIKIQYPEILLISLIMDDPFAKTVVSWRRFLQTVPYYDLHYVAREKNISELKALGAKEVYRFHKGYAPATHCCVTLRQDNKSYEIFFAGHYETKRESDIAFLIRNGIPVTVAHHKENGWENSPHWKTIQPYFIDGGFYGSDYAKAISSSRIALCFYCQANSDMENSRMYEIAACQTLMLAERNDENIHIFEEDKEAVYFSSQEELLEKAKHYLANSSQRKQIAAAGTERCLKSGYSYQKRLKDMLKTVCNLKESNA